MTLSVYSVLESDSASMPFVEFITGLVGEKIGRQTENGCTVHLLLMR